MRVVEIRPPFGPEAVAFVERSVPEAGPGQVLLKVRACGLNYRDLLVRDGVGRWRPGGPRIPTSDAVGVVTAVGPGVSRVAVGERVAPVFYPAWLDGEISPAKTAVSPGGAVADGFLAEFVAVAAEAVVRVPEHLSDLEAATLGTAGVTAWHGLVEDTPVPPGATVVVLGTGGVSLFGLQFARLLGARVIVTSSSDEKLARVRELGAWAGINYHSSADWPAAVQSLTGSGADLVLDTVGDLQASLRALRVGGTLVFVGFLAGLEARLDLTTLMSRAVRLRAVDVGSRASFEAMNRAITAHRLRPLVGAVFRLEEAPEAFRRLAGGPGLGKVVIQLSEPA